MFYRILSMENNRLYTRRDKQAVLACFRAGMEPLEVSEYMRLLLEDVKSWYDLYNDGYSDWARFDDGDAELRTKALMLFEKGFGYRRVSNALSITDWQARFWQKEYLDEKGKGPEAEKSSLRYSDESKAEILNRYAVSTISKNAFCRQYKISSQTLDKWLADEQKKLR